MAGGPDDGRGSVLTRSRRSRRRRLQRRLRAQLALRGAWARDPEDAGEPARDGSAGARRPPAFELVEPSPAAAGPEEEAVTFERAREAANGPAARGEAAHPSVTPVGTGTVPGSGPRQQPSAAASDETATVDLLYRAAREAAARGEVERAVRIYGELLEHAPDHVRARNNLALLLDQLGDHAGALSELDQCLAVEPDNPQVLANRGAVLGAVGRYAEAEAALRRVVHMEPGSAEAHFNLGLVISRKGLWREAIPHLRRAIELDSSRALAYFYLGEALNHVDDLEGALQSYQRAVELRPNNPKALYGLGIILDRMSRPEEAAQMYRRSRELSGR